LQHFIPAGLAERGGDEFGADIAFGEGALVHGLWGQAGLAGGRGAWRFWRRASAMALLASLARLGWRADGWRQEAKRMGIGSDIVTKFSIIPLGGG
jgi:hypothetical protein